MKKTRRYREKCNANTIGITSTYANERIHDFIKGWGTISKLINWGLYFLYPFEKC